MAQNDFYDGVGILSGVSGANPVAVPRTLASNAVNRRFRYGKNTPRCPFKQLQLEFRNDAEQFLFEGGNFQGAKFYNTYPTFENSSIICSIAGAIFKIEVEGTRGIVTKLFEGHDPVLTHSWMEQAFEWLVIQNGYNRPILWNGIENPRFSSEEDNEVPIGSVMAFIHGRLALASADGTNQIAVGDIVYGNTATDTSDIIKFTDTEYWADGGAFGAPVYVGKINGMVAMPYLDTGTGQNELVVLGTEGAISLDLSRPRATWLDSNILRISLIGGGCVSTHSLAAMNGDLFFRSAEGIRSYKNARSEFQQGWSQAPISSDVRRWLDKDDPELITYTSQVSWNNYLFCTCSPQKAEATNRFAGAHRYHRGFVVLDAQPESNTGHNGSPVWNGMWTGIRPTQFVEGRINNAHRCFAFSYDQDGRNRLYEITEEGMADAFEGAPKKMFSFFDTGILGAVDGRSGLREPKILSGGELELSNVHRTTTAELSIRPDDSPCYVPLRTLEAGCECQPRECGDLFRQPTALQATFGASGAGCLPGQSQPPTRLRKLIGRLAMTGWAEFESLLFRFAPDTRSIAENCTQQCQDITCCDQAPYSYHIAPEGVNENAYELPRPSDVPDPVYLGFSRYTARCPRNQQGNPVVVSANAESNISQADADNKAFLAAKAAAEGQLRCTQCAPANISQIDLNDSSVDLSSFFEVGLYPDAIGRPWRMIDEATRVVYASGIVDDNGTLAIVNYVSTGPVTFDPETKILTDTSGTPVRVHSQMGCPSSGSGDEYPDIPDYES